MPEPHDVIVPLHSCCAAAPSSSAPSAFIQSETVYSALARTRYSSTLPHARLLWSSSHVVSVSVVTASDHSGASAVDDIGAYCAASRCDAPSVETPASANASDRRIGMTAEQLTASDADESVGALPPPSSASSTAGASPLSRDGTAVGDVPGSRSSATHVSVVPTSVNRRQKRRGPAPGASARGS